MHQIVVKGPRMSFSSAHFVIGGGKCEALHGHNYLVEIRIAGPLNDDGMVLDFRDVKSDVKKVCDELDHQILLPDKSDDICIIQKVASIEVDVNGKFYSFPKEDCNILPIKATTAELLAEFISGKIDLPKEYSLEVCVCESEGSIGCFTRAE